MLVILFAVLAALAQLLLPMLARHPGWVAEQLSERVHRPVSFASVEGRWTASGPEFVMHDVVVGPAPGEHGAMLHLPEASLRLDLGGWLVPSRHLFNVYARGLQLGLLHDATGWHVDGIGVSGAKDQQPLSLGRWSVDLWLDDLRVEVTDVTLGKRYTLLATKLRVSHQGDQIRFGGALRREGVGAASVRSVGRFSQDGRAGRIWFSVDGVELKSLLDGIDMAGYKIDQGAGQMSAWLDWRDGKLVSSLVRFNLDTLVVSTADGDTARVAALHGLVGVQHREDGYELRWAGDDGSAAVLDLQRPGTPRVGVNAVARKLQLAPLLPWLALKPGLAPSLASWLGSGDPHGELDHVVLRWSREGGLRELALHFDQLGISPVGKLPGVHDLHGVLRGDAQAFSLELPAQATTLEFPHVFRHPFVLSKLDGTLAFWSEDGDWHIGVDTLDFVGAGFAGSARGDAMLPAQGGAPTLDLYATLDHADVTAAKLFWPVNVMSPPTVAWLDQALVAGDLDQAQVLVHGALADWPFRHNEGRFEARAQISGLTLDYGRDWPRAEGVAAVASFVDNGVLVETSAGHALDVNTDRAVALIPDFGQNLLDLNVRGNGSSASLLEFARKSPIANRVAGTLAKLSLSGRGTFNFHLILPLGKVEDAQLDGTAQLQDTDLTAPDWNLDLQKLNGPLRFDLHGLQAGPLETVFHGQPASLQLAIAGANSDPSTVLSASLQGSYQIAELVQDYPSLKWLGELAQGRSPFSVGFTLTRKPDSDALAQTLNVDSSLEGIALQWPAPLDKPAAGSLPLHLTMGLPVGGSDLQLGLGEVLRGHLRLPDGAAQPLAGTLVLGDQMPQTLPARDLRIRGRATTLDVTGWVQQVASGAAGGGPGLESLEVSIDHAGWFGRSLGPLLLRATPGPDVLSVDVKGPAMAGNFSVPTQQMDKRGVTARLSHLFWPKDTAVQPADHDKSRTDGKPAAVVDATLPASDPANTGINPAALPPFHLWVGDLRLGDARLGEARFETWPTAKGMHIE
ncbi:MAG: DUF3971 domain-containing protein, partial [Rhodanobacter sp.]